MLTTPRHTSKLSLLFLFGFTLLLTLCLSLPWVSAQEQPKPQPEPWQINGIVAALDDGHDQVKQYAFDKLNEYDPKDLKLVVQKPEDFAKKAANILKDEKVDSDVRRSAAVALSNFGQAAAQYIPDIANILKDEKVDKYVRGSAASALAKVRKLELNEVVVILNNFYEPGNQEYLTWRFLTFFLGGGTEEVKTLLRWLGDSQAPPNKLTHDEGLILPTAKSRGILEESINEFSMVLSKTPY